jgi:ribosomal protein S18 acetylase RimI-like enzyme
MMMTNPVIIRPFKDKDKDALRQICCNVADRGRPIESFFLDRELAADALTSYYTDYEPQSTFVAEVEGKVIGYINGCCDNRRWGLVMFWILIPGLLCHAFRRRVVFKEYFLKLAYGSMANWRRFFSWRKQEFHSHEGHMHIGIVDEFRHQQVGGKLVAALMAYALTQGVDTLSASVQDNNTAACRFFEGLGFHVRERYPMVFLRGDILNHYQALVYVKELR